MRNLKIFWKMKENKKYLFVFLSILFIMGILSSLCLGATQLTPSQLWKAIQEGIGKSFEGNIFWYVRLPRTLACILSGAGLAVSGAIIQGVLANPLASPSIIGVNAGAGLAVTLCCVAGYLSGWVIAGSAFIGAGLAVLFIVLAAKKVGASRTTVVLGGVAINSFLGAVSEAIRTLMPEVGVISADFRIGGFSSVTLARLLPAGLCIIAAIIILMSLCNELDVLNLGEEMAQGLGMPVKKMRTIFLILAALLAGASVSFAGLLGFIGLVVPHIGRKFVGSESRYLLPFCVLGGAVFVTFCDLLGRFLFQPYEMPVGILMSFIGGPFFLFLLWNSKGGHHHD